MLELVLIFDGPFLLFEHIPAKENKCMCIHYYLEAIHTGITCVVHILEMLIDVEDGEIVVDGGGD